jgi:pSer/pThr/pTyr-binding forkhead associated (FHA) protein
LSPLHAKLSWEDNHLVVRDLGSRNGTWVFMEEPHRLTEGDLLLIGSQLIKFRRLGYPGPHAPEADATKRMGSLTPAADIASLTQLRADGSSRDVIQLSPGRDLQIGRERGDWMFPYDPSMSGQHALIRSEDADFVAVDAGSRNGIAMAARGAMSLKDGSRLLVGDKLLRIEIP